MKKIFILITFYSLIISYEAQANCAKHYCYPVKINEIYPNVNSELVYVGTDADESALNSCTPVAGKLLTLDAGKAGGNKVYSALLTAFSAQIPVSIVPVNGSNNCEISYIQLLR